jgi:hypothetical protein
MASHTAAHRAAELESYVLEALTVKQVDSAGLNLSTAGVH